MVQINRLDTRLAALKESKRKALVTFVTAGYPDLQSFPSLLAGLPDAGADIIEIGVPFSDPMADGPVIQEANNLALKGGITLVKILDMVRKFRSKDDTTPILLMGYYNPIYCYGVQRFLEEAKEAGVDGFIIPDLPPEEDEEFRVPAEHLGLIQIRFVTPTTDEARLDLILKQAKGFLYFVAVAGITGGKTGDSVALAEKVALVQARSPLPVAFGFGVSTPDQARTMAAIADGVIVGSAIINRMKVHVSEDGIVNGEAVSDALSFVRDLASGVGS